MTHMIDVAEIVAENLDFSSTKSLKTVVYSALKKTILNGEIPAGTRINELFLCNKVSISRTPLRSALHRLHDENLLEYVPGSGMIVKGITSKDAYEIFTIRKSLDRLATITAMHEMNDHDFEEFEQIVSLMQKQGENSEELASIFTEFNEFIYSKSQLFRLRDTRENIQNYLSYFRELSVHSNDRRANAIEDHVKLYYYMKTKNEKQVELLLDEHLENALDGILSEMDRKVLQAI